jgi:hypothetical protein
MTGIDRTKAYLRALNWHGLRGSDLSFTVCVLVVVFGIFLKTL